MSVNRDGQLLTFTCDECGQEQSIASRDFKDAWESVRDDHGWICFRDEETSEFVHRCDECRGK